MDNAKVRRSRTGCVTCRGRKVRCDEQHPVCGACTRLHLTCAYVAPDQPGKSSRKTERARHPRFRVRFVDADKSKPQGGRTDVRGHQGGVSTQQQQQRQEAQGTAPSSSPSSITQCGEAHTAVSSREDHALQAFTTSPPSSVLWSTGSGSDSPSHDAFMSLCVPSLQVGTHGGSMEESVPIPENTADLLDSFTLQTDMTMLWDNMPPFDDFGAGFGGSLEMADLNTGDESTVDVTPPAATPPPEPEITARPHVPKQMVSIRPEDTEPLQHFLSTMVQFVKLRSSASDNIYCHIFTNMGLTHAPLYEAILAWAALHLSHVKSASTRDAEQRYQRASALLFEDSEAADHVDLTLVTVWFLLQYDLFNARGVDRFMRLLNYVADIVEVVFENHHVAEIKEKLGPVAIRVLIWLSAYDGRAAMFGNTCRLLRCLKMHPHIYDIIDTNEKGPAIDHFGAPNEAGSMELKACLRLALRLNIVRGSCSLLGRWQGDSIEREATWTALYSSLEAVQREVEQDLLPAAKVALRVANGDMDVPIAISTLEYNWMQLLATYYAGVITYLRHRPTSSPNAHNQTMNPLLFPDSKECAAKIIRLSRHVTLSRSNSPQAIWPHILFQAGIETGDPIYQSWVLGAFAQAEAWGPNMRKTRLLLERLIKFRKEVKGPYDITALMDTMGGPFVI